MQAVSAARPDLSRRPEGLESLKKDMRLTLCYAAGAHVPPFSPLAVLAPPHRGTAADRLDGYSVYFDVFLSESSRPRGRGGPRKSISLP